MKSPLSLQQIGWQPFFQQQLTLEEWEHLEIARVTEPQRSMNKVMTVSGERMLPVTSSMPPLTVGDWVLMDGDGKFIRVLERLSLISRKAAGTKVAVQLIAANINTLFITSSLNQDFNLNRIERYLVLANDANVEPVVVLTKVDQCDDLTSYIQQVQALNKQAAVVAVNSLDSESVKQLDPWCQLGNTVALLGSSGVGKSTIINTLIGVSVQRTHSIREDDDKGRHTTTARSLHFLPSGAVLLDTPGMREIKLAACEHGIEETFADISELATQCKFTDCQHQEEPGCKVQAAIRSGTLDIRRLNSFRKLLREQALNEASLAERRAKDRQLGRFYKSVQAGKRKHHNE